MASIQEPCGCLSVLFFNLIVHVFSDIIITKDTPELYDFDFFIRDEWETFPASNRQPLKLPAPYVVIHHTPEISACYELSECLDAMRVIQIQHIFKLKLGDIGYNFCVGSEGGVFEGRGWDHIGAHSGRADNHSIGICMIGDWENTKPPEIQMDALKALLRTGVLTGKVKRDYKLIGHKQTRKTNCPGNALMKELSTWEHFAPERHNFTEPAKMSVNRMGIQHPPYHKYSWLKNNRSPGDGEGLDAIANIRRVLCPVLYCDSPID
ncbi:unnamed protein product [Arctia plantaginis]|uniref:Peptidoglycan recognition protein n=1 Tax=Arctia plantaginis TaxID=874455 RepID=A0A8S1AM51_ARCPL|nr:unnamed protein product [Arctia plantaginis]